MTKKGFTLVELLVVMGIIGVLAAMLMPALQGAREAALAAGSAQNLAGFGKGIKMFQAEDAEGRMCSGAFDHLRDGDVRMTGWVADQITGKNSNPGKALDGANPSKLNEKVLDYTGCTNLTKANRTRWGATLSGTTYTGGQTENVFFGGGNGPDGFGTAADKARLWDEGFNTNYATSWQFVRGDPTIGSGSASGAYLGYNIYGEKGTTGGNADKAMDTDNRDSDKCPLDGDGPLSTSHFTRQSQTSPDRVPLIGAGRPGDGTDAKIDSTRAGTINAFAGRKVCKAGDQSVESFCDGMQVSLATSIDPTARTGEIVHEFNDIQPIHSGRDTVLVSGTAAGTVVRGLVGGYANILFADGSVRKVKDVGGLNGRPDGQLGAHATAAALAGGSGATTMTLTQSGYDEIKGEIWARRVALPQQSGGGVQE